MGFSGAAHGLGGGGEPKRPPPTPLPKICCTYSATVKFGPVIPYLKEMQKLYGSRDTHI